mgnify:CR=1 FL=1
MSQTFLHAVNIRNSDSTSTLVLLHRSLQIFPYDVINQILSCIVTCIQRYWRSKSVFAYIRKQRASYFFRHYRKKFTAGKYSAQLFIWRLPNPLVSRWCAYIDGDFEGNVHGIVEDVGICLEIGWKGLESIEESTRETMDEAIAAVRQFVMLYTKQKNKV